MGKCKPEFTNCNRIREMDDGEMDERTNASTRFHINFMIYKVVINMFKCFELNSDGKTPFFIQ
jgi:hypothetical protein